MRWLPVPGYEGLYEVSDHGQIRSVVSGQIKAQKWHKRVGHWRVDLWQNNTGKTHLVSRLVLLAFVGVPPVKSWTASHLNGDPRDNRLENLMWESMKDNNDRRLGHGTLVFGETASWSKLTEEQVTEIKTSPLTQSALAAKFGINQSNVSRIKRGKRWVHH